MIRQTLNRIYHRFLSDEQGASSVLILLMMITLVTLGTYSISSSQVNYVFSSKALEWNLQYLEADTRGEEFLRQLNQALAEAERKTVIDAINHSLAVYDMSPRQALLGLYMSTAQEEIAKLERPDLTLDGNTLTVDVSSNNCHINIAVMLAPFRFSFSDDTTAQTNNAPRYTVLKWEQWQETSDNTFQQTVWDGLITE
jgi:hypothetical protein